MLVIVRYDTLIVLRFRMGRSGWMSRWEASLDDLQEGGGHVGLDPLVEWWVKPNNPFAAAPPPRLVGSLLCAGWDVGELVLMAGLLEGLLVRWDGCLEDRLA